MFNDSIIVFIFEISEMIEVCKFGLCCVNYNCLKSHPKCWSPSSGAFTKAKIAEKNAKKESKKLEEAKKSENYDVEYVKKIESSILENLRKAELYTEISQWVKFEYYSWFWKEAEYIKARNDEINSENKELLKYESIYFGMFK